MDFMGFNIVDIVIGALILFLAIKGLVNGFSKELVNFLTIVGGIFLAARFNTTVVNFINEQQIVPTIPDGYAKLIGFLIIVIIVWLIMGVISAIIAKLNSKETGILSRIVGYLLSTLKYIAIFSLIIFGINQADFFKNQTVKLKKETKLFMPMVNIGATLLNVEQNTTLVKENNNTDVTEMKVTKESNEKNESSVENDTNLTLTPTTDLVEYNNSN